MLHLHDQITAAAAFIGEHFDTPPKVAIILGTGLGPLVGEIEVAATLSYDDIPHFLSSTATSHAGRLICGTLDGVPIVAMEGRHHYYEGYRLDAITLPVRVFKALGAELLIVTNACGAMNPAYASGDIMVIDDQINLIGDNPLIGINDDRLGPRFPDMSRPYSPRWIDEALAVARRNEIYPHVGVFVAVAGPCLETRAEYRFLRMIGADVVGMSTVPEVIVAVHAGLPVLGLSVVTDMCLPDALKPAVVEEIIAVAGSAEPKLRTIVRGVVSAAGGTRVA